MVIRLKTPLLKKDLIKLKVKDEVYLSGIIYTMRDRSSQLLVELIKKRKKLPLDLKNQVIYYCGPNFKGKMLGACGPTTSRRMDIYLEELLKKGLSASVGKGERSFFVRDLCRKYKSVYFLTYGGCGAYLRERIKRYKLIAFPHLGSEAIYEFEVEDFPLIVGIDTEGNSIRG